MADVTAATTWNCPVYILQAEDLRDQQRHADHRRRDMVIRVTPLAADKSALIVARGSQLIAKGTKDEAHRLHLGQPGRHAQGRRLGRRGPARRRRRSTAASACTSDATAGCLEAGIEGIPATELQGEVRRHRRRLSCGELQYVRIEFAGAELEPDARAQRPHPGRLRLAAPS